MENQIVWAKIVLILGGLAGVFVSEIFDTGVLTLVCSIVVLLVGIFSTRSGGLTELAMKKDLLRGREGAKRNKEKGAPEDNDA